MAKRRPPRTKTKVKFWWEVYRTLVTTPSLRDVLGLDRAWNDTLAHYKSWGDVVGVSYDAWWKEHRGLFLDEVPPVREITTSHFKRDPNCLYLELNLKRSPDSLLKWMRSLLRTKIQLLNRGKNKTRIQPLFGFTEKAEIRPSVYNDYLRFLKEVYAPNCQMQPRGLRAIAQPLFIKWRTRQDIIYDHDKKEEEENKKKGGDMKKIKKGRTTSFLPLLHLDPSEDGTPIAYVSINRYLKKVQRLCRAVAQGEFPGKA